MRPMDVDKIAEAVVGSLAGPSTGLLGCGSISSPINFDVDLLNCGHFECGGAAPFSCTQSFSCGGAANGAAQAFYCDTNFTCSNFFGSTIDVCVIGNAVLCTLFGCQLIISLPGPPI